MRRLGGAAPTPEEAKTPDEAELAERVHQRAGQDKTARKLIELSPRRWRVAKTARLADIGESRRQMARQRHRRTAEANRVMNLDEQGGERSAR
jgi:hypothetical protein